MKKTILSALMICMSIAMFAQKFGHVNSIEVIEALPERTAAQTKIEGQAKILEENMVAMRNEYQQKVAEFGNGEQFTESVRKSKYNNIIQLENEIQTFQLDAEQELQQMQNDLLAPILTKLQDAIDAVGKENGFTYIFDSTTGATVYNGGEDVTPLVKTKLGM